MSLRPHTPKLSPVKGKPDKGESAASNHEARSRSSALREGVTPTETTSCSSEGINHAEKLYEFLDRHRRMPTYRELVHVWNYKTKSAVDYRIRKLLAAGLIGKEGRQLIAKR